jgi:hypothetical protein
MPTSALLNMDDRNRHSGPTSTQDAVNRRCLLAQTRHFGGYQDQFNPAAVDTATAVSEPSAEPPRRFEPSEVEELDADNLTDMLKLPIRSNFRVLARISQLLRESPDFV